MHTCIRKHICLQSCKQKCIQKCVHTCMHSDIQIHIHTYTRACIHTCMHTYMHTWNSEMHANMHTTMHTSIYTSIYTYIHTTTLQLLTDISHDEIRVFSSDLQDSNEISSGLDVVGAFKLYDMVLLESASASLAMPSVGVVIQLEKDLLQVFLYVVYGCVYGVCRFTARVLLYLMHSLCTCAYRIQTLFTNVLGAMGWLWSVGSIKL